MQGLRSAICNFYLALRGLDTVEDDMDNFPVVADKIAHLKRFHTYLRDPKWFLNGAWPLGVCDAIAGCPKCPSSYVLPVAHLRQWCWVCAVLHCAGWAGIGQGAERELLESFGHVSTVFLTLPGAQQAVIADITARMGDGMALYIARNLRQGTTDIADYNLYCHFVAGLVGEGLSGIFSAAGYEGAC